MTWTLYRILNDLHEQLPLAQSAQAGLTFDPQAKRVQREGATVETTTMVMAHKDGRRIAVVRLADQPELRYAFEAGPALPRENTERAKGLKAGIEDVLPDVTNYPATIGDCYEQGDLVFLEFDLDHDNGEGHVATAERSASDEEVERQLIKDISDTQCEVFEGYHPDDIDM